jgi:hypothetical protein
VRAGGLTRTLSKSEVDLGLGELGGLGGLGGGADDLGVGRRDSY